MSERKEFFHVGSRPRIEVRISSGRVSVDAHDDGAVEAVVQGKNADGFTIEQYGDSITIRQPSDRGLLGGSYRVFLRVPSDCEIDVSVASANLDVLAPVGDLRVSTASGDVNARSIQRDLTVKTASGDVDVDQVGGRVQITAASSDIEISEIGRHCVVTTASGDLEIRSVSGDVRVKTASGDVSIDRALGGEINCKTVSGDLRVGIPSGRSVAVDLQTMSGSVHLPDGRQEVSDGPSEGSVSVRFRSVSGDIRLERA